LHNDELHNLYSSMGRTCNMHGGGKTWLQSFGWKAQREETNRET
jgi:hypothetical protein